MTIQFKCKQTGQVYEFQDQDAAEMRKHFDYEEVLPEPPKPEKLTLKKPKDD
jgi:hypothetical protein